MPDIMLLPLIADIFGVSVDALFGRKQQGTSRSSYDANEICTKSLLDCLYSMVGITDGEVPYDKRVNQYKQDLQSDSDLRTLITNKNGAVYYRNEIGGLILNKSLEAWEMLQDKSALDTLKLFTDRDFCNALSQILKSGKTTFTMSSITKFVSVESPEKLHLLFEESGLFRISQVDIDDKPVTIYEFWSNNFFLIYAVFAFAKEFQEYKENYCGFHANHSFGWNFT